MSTPLAPRAGTAALAAFALSRPNSRPPKHRPPVILATVLFAALLLTGHVVALVVLVVLLAAAAVPAVRTVPYAGPVVATTAHGARVTAGAWWRCAVVARVWVAVTLLVALVFTHQAVHVVVLLVACWAVGRFYAPKPPAPWWSNVELVRTLTTAGVLPATKADEPPTRLYMRGTPTHTEHGTSVVVGLPAPATFASVVAKRDCVASALRVPLNRLHLTQHRDDPANTVRITVSTGHTADATATVTTADRTTWDDPLRIGRDNRGEPVTVDTFEANTLLAGIPGSGKTTTARLLLSHFLLDPATRVYLLDGKGSRKDYGACVPLCERYVSGTDDDAAAETVDLLTTVLGIVRARNNSDEDDRHPGALLLLEEFQDVRAAASKAQRDALDTTLGRIVRMGRAVSVHVVVSTQRPTVDDLPSGTRNLLSQRLALQLRNAADASIVLGEAPALSLPSARGEALYTRGGPARAVALDYLTDRDWSAVCQRAKALRRTTPGTSPEPSDGHVEAPAPSTPADPLVDAAVQVLRAADPGGLSATRLHDALPEETRQTCRSPLTLAVALARSDAGLVEKGHAGANRVWRLTPAARHNLSATCQEPVNDPSTGPAEPVSVLSVDTFGAPDGGHMGAAPAALPSVHAPDATTGVPR